MLKEYIKKCILFQSKEQSHIVLGICSWGNIIALLLGIISFINNL